jgi:hypothetical protein
VCGTPVSSTGGCFWPGLPELPVTSVHPYSALHRVGVTTRL